MNADGRDMAGSLVLVDEHSRGIDDHDEEGSVAGVSLIPCPGESVIAKRAPWPETVLSARRSLPIAH